MSNVPLYRLDPTADFLTLTSNHFAKDLFNRFKYLVDIAAIISRRHERLNTKEIYQTARQYSFVKRLDTGLELTWQLLGIEWPERKKVSLDVPLLRLPLQYPIAMPNLYIGEWDFLKHLLNLQDNFLCRCRVMFYAAVYIFIPTDSHINDHKLPAWALPWLMITRPFRLIRRLRERKKQSITR